MQSFINQKKAHKYVDISTGVPTKNRLQAGYKIYVLYNI